MTCVTHNLARVWAEIAAAAREFGRDPQTIRLVAVSKQHGSEAVHEALAAGQIDFGENLLQEALPKIQAIVDPRVCWHFIGPIQSNKTRPIAEHFSWVQTIDRPKIVQRLARQRPNSLDPLNVCIQVKLGDEPTKSGIPPTAVAPLAEEVMELPRLRLRGLMCLPPLETEFDRQRANFRLLRELYEELVNAGMEIDTMSMGMTGDFRAAIAEGATMVRLGTRVFGPRRT